jgi:hypothetical protein
MFAIPEAKKTSKPNLSIYISDTSTIKLNQSEEARALLVKRRWQCRNWERKIEN